MRKWISDCEQWAESSFVDQKELMLRWMNIVNVKRKLKRSDVEEEEEWRRLIWEREREKEDGKKCESDENHWKNTVSGGEGYENKKRRKESVWARV